MKKVEVDTARLPLLLRDLRLPAIGRLWPEDPEQAFSMATSIVK